MYTTLYHHVLAYLYRLLHTMSDQDTSKAHLLLPGMSTVAHDVTVSLGAGASQPAEGLSLCERQAQDAHAGS